MQGRSETQREVCLFETAGIRNYPATYLAMLLTFMIVTVSLIHLQMLLGKKGSLLRSETKRNITTAICSSKFWKKLCSWNLLVTGGAKEDHLNMVCINRKVYGPFLLWHIES